MNILEPAGTATAPVSPAVAPLPLLRVNLMRGGYLLMGVGLAIVKWPLLPHVGSQPLYQGLFTCLLTALSLLAFLGLRHPVRMLPVLLFECAWKLIWLSLVAVPAILADRVDDATGDVIFACSLVAVILAVTPWRYAWRTYVTARGDRWL